MRAWGRLFRIALAPTAVADVLAGTVLGAGAWPGGASVLWLIAASLAVYHGALALNDWADREWDATVRPDRPIPSGAVRPAHALTASLALLAASPALAALAVARGETNASAVGCVGALALALLLALAYDLGPRGPRLGPMLLAGCRACNLGAGVLFGASTLPGGFPQRPVLAALVVAAYGAYVFLVSRLGRLEDREDGTPLESLPARLLRRLALVLAGVGALDVLRSVLLEGQQPPGRSWIPAAIGAAGALGLWRASRRTSWSPGDVMAAMGLALRRLLVFTATAALLVPGRAALVVAVLVLTGFPISWGLRRISPPS